MASQQAYDGLGDSSSELVKDEPSCCDKLTACPGNFSHFLYHDGFFCLLRPLLWCQLTTFLVCLWLVSGLFWYLMWFFVIEWPTKALWAFLVCWGLFTALFAVLMALDIDDGLDFDGLGCTEKELKDHITRLMEPKMTWDTFGYKWHIVQRIPLHEDNPSAELADRIKQVCQRMHYSNTIPVWADEIARGSVLKQVNPDGPPSIDTATTTTTTTTTTTIEDTTTTVEDTTSIEEKAVNIVMQ